MVKVIMHGCNGKMGQVITGIIAEDADVEIVAGVDASNHIQNTYPVFSNIADCNVEADVVYKVKNKNVFILIEHQSSLDLKMAYRILRYKNAIIESAINKRRLKEKNYKIPKVIPIVLYTGKRKWQKLSIEDIEEKIEGYEEIELGYDLVDTNELT